LKITLSFGKLVANEFINFGFSIVAKYPLFSCVSIDFLFSGIFKSAIILLKNVLLLVIATKLLF
jgi:hypothetical protein